MEIVVGRYGAEGGGSGGGGGGGGGLVGVLIVWGWNGVGCNGCMLY